MTGGPDRAGGRPGEAAVARRVDPDRRAVVNAEIREPPCQAARRIPHARGTGFSQENAGMIIKFPGTDVTTMDTLIGLNNSSVNMDVTNELIMAICWEESF